MGKPLIQQRRGKGSSTFRAPSFRYKGRASYGNYIKEATKGKILDIINCPGHSAPLVEIKYENGEEVLPNPLGISPDLSPDEQLDLLAEKIFETESAMNAVNEQKNLYYTDKNLQWQCSAGKIVYYLMRLPNILHKSVPTGKDESENKEVRKYVLSLVGEAEENFYDLREEVVDVGIFIFKFTRHDVSSKAGRNE